MFLFGLYVIVELPVSHDLICVYACWILLEAEMYVFVAFHKNVYFGHILILVVYMFIYMHLYFFFIMTHSIFI